jgi:methionine-rich copper-binding protein CopC
MRAMCSLFHAVISFYAVLWLMITSLILLCPASLLAHATLIRADPAVNAHISEYPSEIRLWFSESIEHRFSRISVHRATRDAATGELRPQERVDAGLASGAGVTRDLAVKLPETLPPGLYLVQWQVFSIDSHRTTGTFTLTYDPQAAKARDAGTAKSTR